jgi:carboxypeptidase Taq
MTAAQLFNAAKLQVPEMLDEIRGGNFTPLLNWLRANVHNKGKFLSFDELLTGATGEPLDANYFKRHLQQRYLGG